MSVRRQSPGSAGWHPQLDGLRAIAVVLVFFHHWTSSRPGLGIIGVQLFFVLSGFLITGILLRERERVDRGDQSISFSMRRFYTRRCLRIFPLYYFCLALFVVLGRFEIRKTILWFAFYLSNVLFFVRGEFFGPFAHFWTLAVEEQFYLVWPWVVLLTPRKRLVPVLVVLVAFAPFARTVTYLSGRQAFVQTSTLVWANLDTLGAGALLAFGEMNSKRVMEAVGRVFKWLVPLCLIEVVACRVMEAGAVWVWLDSLAVSVISAWAILGASRGISGFIGRALSHPVAVYLGKISYGLYVWHMFAPAFLRNILKLLHLPDTYNSGVAGFILLSIWTVITASTTWFLLERPINRLKERFTYREAGSEQPLTQPFGAPAL